MVEAEGGGPRDGRGPAPRTGSVRFGMGLRCGEGGCGIRCCCCGCEVGGVGDCVEGEEKMPVRPSTKANLLSWASRARSRPCR